MMDEVSFIRVAVAFVFVVGLMGGCIWVLKRWQLFAEKGQRGAGRRLSVSEQLYLDPKRRVVLLRCDEQEHLLLIGAQQEQLITSMKVVEKENGESHATA